MLERGALHQRWYRGAGPLSLNPPGKPAHPAPSPSRAPRKTSEQKKSPSSSQRCPLREVLGPQAPVQTSENAGPVQREEWVFVPGALLGPLDSPQLQA